MQEQRDARPERYRIVVAGHLVGDWSEWFAGLTVTQEGSRQTVLAGPIADQAALHGVLIRIRDLGLPLLELSRTDPDGAGQCAITAPRGKGSPT